jgi:hypothetical protein
LPYRELVTLVDGELTHTWNNLYVYDDEGNPFIYTVEEVNVPENWISTYVIDANGIFVFTNAFEKDEYEAENNSEVRSLPNTGSDNLRTAILFASLLIIFLLTTVRINKLKKNN